LRKKRREEGLLWIDQKAGTTDIHHDDKAGGNLDAAMTLLFSCRTSFDQDHLRRTVGLK
jgi:hypothetical protein